MKKANGDGSIYYEASRKKYCAAITDKNGKRTRKRFDTQAEAKKWLKESLADVEREEFVKPSQYTVLQWVMDYIEIYKKPHVKATTLDKALSLAALMKPIGKIKLQDLTPLQVQKFYNSLDGYSSSTRCLVHVLLKESYRTALQNGLVKKNVVELVPRPKWTTSKIDLFTDEELSRLKEVCSRVSFWKCIFLLALSCGLRRGEVLGLQIEDVFDDYIYIRHNLTQLRGKFIMTEPKWGSTRKVPVTDEVKEVLKVCIGDRTEGFVILNKYGNNVSPSNFNRYWWQKQNMAKVPRKHFHSLRHSFATKMLAAGVPVANVSKLLGHATPYTTYEVYAHSVPELDSQMNKIIENATKIEDVAPTVAPTPNK